MSKRDLGPEDASARSRSPRLGRWAILASVILALGSLVLWQLVDHGPAPAAASYGEYQELEPSDPFMLGSRTSDGADNNPNSKDLSPSADRESPDAKPAESSFASGMQPTELELDKSPDSASQDMKKEKALDLEAKSTTARQMEVHIVGFTSVKAKARGVGEISGNALAVQLSIKNSGSKSLDLSRAAMLLFVGENLLPTSELDNSAATPFPSKLDVGKSATGSFVFTVPDSWKSKVTVQFIADPTSNILIFEGKPRLERSTQ